MAKKGKSKKMSFWNRAKERNIDIEFSQEKE